jgi:hypothetical protein
MAKKYMIHDYSKVTEEQSKALDFSNEIEYILSDVETFELIQDIFWGEKGRNYAFYSKDNQFCFLDLS